MVFILRILFVDTLFSTLLDRYHLFLNTDLPLRVSVHQGQQV